MSQRGLFDDIPERRKLSIEERFREYHSKNPEIYALFKRFAFELKRAGRKHYGAKSIMETIRFHYATSSQEDDFKINNIYTSRYVRMLVEECPEFIGFFELRKLQSP